jgi:hypothetical protein
MAAASAAFAHESSALLAKAAYTHGFWGKLQRSVVVVVSKMMDRELFSAFVRHNAALMCVLGAKSGCVAQVRHLR